MEADTALIQGKNLGRNRKIIFQPQMRNRVVEAAHIGSQIKEGLRTGKFIPYFQPQIEWPSGRLYGLEALARWQKPDGTTLPASAFIDIANETGQIIDIDHQVSEIGLDTFQKLGAAGLERASMSFNFSRAQSSAPNLVKKVTEIVAHRGIAFAQITIEVLETTLPDPRSSMIAKNIHALADTEFRIELDDFGIGHTALASLRWILVHGIKIDRCLIQSIDKDPSLQAITDRIFNLCESLKIDVIAEGVETNAELSMLIKMALNVFPRLFVCKTDALRGVSDHISAR